MPLYLTAAAVAVVAIAFRAERAMGGRRRVTVMPTNAAHLV